MKKTFKLIGLDCANCGAKIENSIKKIENVSSATVNFMTTKLIIECDDNCLESVVEKISAIVKKTDSKIQIKAI